MPLRTRSRTRVGPMLVAPLGGPIFGITFALADRRVRVALPGVASVVPAPRP